MNSESLNKILATLAAVVILAGCAATPVPYEVRDAQGTLIMKQPVELDRPEALLKSLHGAFAQGNYRRCRGLSEVARNAWLENAQIVQYSRRLAAWCLLFTYESERPSISALENEARNLRILDAALNEYGALSNQWSEESRVIELAVDRRVRNLEAFEDTLAALQRASRADSEATKRAAITGIAQKFPEWASETRIQALSRFTWNTWETDR